MESSLPVAQIDFTQPSNTTEEEGNRNEGNEQAFSSEVMALAVSEGKDIEPETVKDAEYQTTEFDYIRKIDYFKTSNVIAWK